MTQVKRYYRLAPLAALWRKMEKEGAVRNPFNRYEWMRRTVNHWSLYRMKERRRLEFYVFSEEGQPMMLMPCERKRNLLRGGVLRVFGNVNGFNYSDVLARCDESSISKYVKKLTQKGPVEFHKVRDDSPLWQALREQASEVKDTICVKIEVNDEEHEAYLKRLSSHTRQNLRTAYNRMERDGRTFELQAIRGCRHEDKALWREIMALYVGRHESRYGVKGSRLKNWLLCHYHFATDNYRHNPETLTLVLKIDGRIAAFMSGLLGVDEYVVPRLSINDEYRFYSPGMLLVNETVQYLREMRLAKWLDLSQGQESYKYKMGGVEHVTHTFRINQQSIIIQS